MEELNEKIKNLRYDFARHELDETHCDHDPVKQFEKWFHQAIEAEVREPMAMSLSTVSELNKPSSRILYLRGVDLEKGFSFYTNYSSSKGKDIEANPYGAMLFFWPELERQVRIEGKLEKVETANSDAYFAERPRASQIGAWSSPQSAVIAGRGVLDENVQANEKKFEQFDTVPRPDHWGGYRLIPVYFEFWQGRPSRLHDRIVYEQHNGGWKISRLAP